MTELANKPQRVTVADFDMPFGSIMAMMIKVAIASIPAAILIGVLVAVVAGLLAAIGSAAL